MLEGTLSERWETNINESEKQAEEQQVRSRIHIPGAFVCLLFWLSLKTLNILHDSD